jgi:hypothetical protein
MRAVLGVAGVAGRPAPGWAELAGRRDGGVHAGKVTLRRDGGSADEEGAGRRASRAFGFALPGDWKDLALIGCTTPLLLRRRATLPTGPVLVLLNARSGLGTQEQTGGKRFSPRRQD